MTEVAEKWGFGMAPPKLETQQRRLESARFTAASISDSVFASFTEQQREMISETKGLFTRVFKADQWDWFTVNSQLGYPSARIAKTISENLTDFRKFNIEGNQEGFTIAQSALRRLPTRKCLGVFLGNVSIKNEVGAGWIYILSTRDAPKLLKIGMTTRSVEQRVKEINGATGIAVPFGVRRCWRVSNPSVAETIVHRALSKERVRNDREFFRVDFLEAAKIISAVLQEHNLELRTLNNLASLA